MGDKKSSDEPVDIYRDTPVRLLGYANEVGEAFRSLVHKNVVHGSYVVASGYVLADTYDKTIKILQHEGKDIDSSEVNKKCAAAALDTLVWQALASVMVPGFTINRLCHFSGLLIRKALPKVPTKARNWTTTLIGLGAIPFIVHPIDTGVHVAMDHTIRKIY